MREAVAEYRSSSRLVMDSIGPLSAQVEPFIIDNRTSLHGDKLLYDCAFSSSVAGGHEESHGRPKKATAPANALTE